MLPPQQMQQLTPEQFQQYQAFMWQQQQMSQFAGYPPPPMPGMYQYAPRLEQQMVQQVYADAWQGDAPGTWDGWYGEGAEPQERARASGPRRFDRRSKAMDGNEWKDDGNNWRGWNGQREGPKAPGHQKKGKWTRGNQGNESEPKGDATTKQQSFYEKPKGKKNAAEAHSAAAGREMELVATMEAVEEVEVTGRKWQSKRVNEKKQQAAKEKESAETTEKPKGKEKSGGWGDGLTREVRISKTLTQILRHKALDLEIEIRPDGYCSLRKVLECPWLSEMEVSEDDVQKVVKKSDKKRFELKEEDSEVMIRAVQGHSIKVIDDDKLLKKLDLTNLPDNCVHGTYRKHFESIKKGGLLAGGGQGQGFRNHVHFSAFAPGDKRVISGMRYDCEIAIWIDLKKAIQDDVPFYMSTNQVILSPGINGVIDKKYFKRARDLQKKEELVLSTEVEK